MTKIRYCEYCGSTLLPDAQFCENCGRPAAPVRRQNSRKRNDTAAEKVKREAESQTPERRVRRAAERTGESRRTEATYGSEVSGQRVRCAPERTGESRRMENASGSEVSGQRVRRAPERTGESRRTETASGSEVSGRRVRRVPERTRGGRPVRRMAEERMEERDSGVFRERGADPQKSGSVQESRIYVPGEKVRARREADAARNLQNRGGAYVPGEKARQRSGPAPYGRPPGNVLPNGGGQRREGTGGYREGYAPQGYPPQEYRFRQQQLDPQWEESWNRMEEEENPKGNPVQYVLIGAAVILAAAIIGFCAFWFLGRSEEKGEDERRLSATEAVQTERATEAGTQNITILEGGNTQTPVQAQTQDAAQTQAPAQTETQAPAQTETQAPAQTETQAPVQTETQAPVQTETQAPIQAETQPVQAQAQAWQTAAGGGYILAESSQRALTEGDVSGMSYDDMQMAINEIYARHGRKFGSSGIQSYFESQPWYQGSVEPEQFDESVFSYTEQQNIQFLLQKMGAQ